MGVIVIVICVVFMFWILDHNVKLGVKVEEEERYKMCKTLGLSPIELDEFTSLLKRDNVSTYSNKERFDYYLEQFKSSKGIPNNLSLQNNNQTTSKVQTLLDIAELGVTFIKTSYLQEKLTKEGEFELLLFNSLIILNELADGKLTDFEEIKENYFETLVNSGIYKYGIKKDVNYLGHLLNSRMYFFSEEMNKLFNDSNYTPMKLYSVFFENPLIMKVEITGFSLLNSVQFYLPLTEMIVLIRDKAKQQRT